MTDDFNDDFMFLRLQAKTICQPECVFEAGSVAGSLCRTAGTGKAGLRLLDVCGSDACNN